MNSKTIISSVILLIVIGLASCDTFRDNEYSNYTESYKTLEGEWKLKSVSQNGVDISTAMDFSQFRLKLNADGNYSIENYLPFAVKKDGQWKVDDPQYPFNLIFREDGSGTDITLGIKYPIVEGKRTISVSVKPGCFNNTYVYEFEKNDTIK